MDCEYSEDQERLRESVRAFLDAKAPIHPYVRQMYDDDRGTTDAVWQGLAGLGLTGLLVAEEHGGSGGSLVDMGVVLEEMGRLVHPGPFLSSAVASVLAIQRVASAEQQAALLPPIAAGSTVCTLALAEPGTRRPWAAAGTRASTSGEGFAVTGTKVFVPDALAADAVLVPATFDGATRLFLVERHAAGVHVTPHPTVDGSRKFATVVLDGAPAQMLGQGDAAAALDAVVDRLLVALVLDGVGAAEAALQMAVAYAKERVQFDRPIGSFQAVQHLLSDMLQNVELGRAAAYYALWTADGAPAEECHRAATMAKAFASDAFFKVGADTIQVFGGIGYTWEHDAHLYYKRLLTLQHSYGGTADHLAELADLIL